MKSMMKKTLSVIIALAMILVPMSVFAAEGDADQPYQLSTDSFRFSIYVAPGATAYIQATDSNDTVVTVGYVGGVESGEQSYNYVVQYGRQYLQPDRSGAVIFQMAEGYDTFTFTNNGEEEVFAMMTLQAAPVAGTVDNPEVLTLSDPWGMGILSANAQTALEAGNDGYFYTVTAPGDGAIKVTVDSYTDEYEPLGWMYNVNNVTAGIYGDTHWSDDEEPVWDEMVNVSAGDEVQIFISTYDPASWTNPAGNVAVNVGYVTVGSWELPVEVVPGTYTASTENGNAYFYEYTATEAGTATVTMNDVDGWLYNIEVASANGTYYGDAHYSDDDPVVVSESVDMEAGDILTICVSAYDPAVWGAPGDVNWTLDFTTGTTGGDDNQGGEDIGGGEEPTENYIVSDETLAVGENSYSVDSSYEYTVYVFAPTEVGEYTLSSSDLMGIVGYHWVNGNPTPEMVAENEIVWECTAVGQSIYVAVKTDANSTNINITRDELDTSDDIVWIDYENMTTPEEFTFDENADELVYVDVEDEVDDSMNVYYNAEDGLYHYGSEDGPVIYVNLDESMMSMLQVVSNGKLVGANNEECTELVNCTNAIMEYIACADVVETADGTLMLYPLTDDLIVFYIACGSYMGWYGEEGWLGLDTPDAWMFACYYVPAVDDGGDNTGDNTGDNVGDNTGDNTGDNVGDNTDDNTGNVADPEIPNTNAEAFGVAFAMMATAAALGATAIATKKSKRVK